MTYGQRPGLDPNPPRHYCPSCRQANRPHDTNTTHLFCFNCGTEFLWRTCGCAYRTTHGIADPTAPPAPVPYTEPG